jgi:hypothetical protein
MCVPGDYKLFKSCSLLCEEKLYGRGIFNLVHWFVKLLISVGTHEGQNERLCWLWPPPDTFQSIIGILITEP